MNLFLFLILSYGLLTKASEIEQITESSVNETDYNDYNDYNEYNDYNNFNDYESNGSGLIDSEYGNQMVFNLSDILQRDKDIGIQNDSFPISIPEECKCIKGYLNKIVGGGPARKHNNPWMVELLYDRRFFCGGCLICKYYVLTAGHCTYGFDKRRMIVKLGVYQRFNSPNSIYRRVVNIYRRKSFNIRTLRADISILELDHKVEQTDDIHSICLPQPGDMFAGKLARVTGWGTTTEGGKVSKVLKQVKIRIHSKEYCSENTVYGNNVGDFKICAGKAGKDACQGDSGGPLVVMHDNKHVLAGIVSYGRGCAQPNAPGVYTRVSKYLGWIKETVGKKCPCVKLE